MAWIPMSDAIRRDVIRHDELSLRRKTERVRLVGPLRRSRRRRAA